MNIKKSFCKTLIISIGQIPRERIAEWKGMDDCKAFDAVSDTFQIQGPKFHSYRQCIKVVASPTFHPLWVLSFNKNAKQTIMTECSQRPCKARFPLVQTECERLNAIFY